MFKKILPIQLLRNVLSLVLILSACSPAVKSIQNNPKESSPVSKIPLKKNLILLIGDGMGLSQISAGFYAKGQNLELERCKHIGLIKTHAEDDLIADSAAGASAISTGQKTKNAYLALNADGQKTETIMEEAIRRNFRTGIIVSSTLVHATPAAFLSHQKDRNLYENIALELAGSNCHLAIGGGKKYFDRRISDTLVLSNQLKAQGYYVTDYYEQDFRSFDLPKVSKLFYFTADGDPLPYSKGREYMLKATQQGIDFLQQGDSSSGFFLMVEGSQIDWGAHSNEGQYVIEEMLEFDRLVGCALDFAQKNPNTLVVITADHETGGLAINPDSKFGKLNLGFTTRKHTGTMVPVFAYGPDSEKFCGIYDNTEIYYKLKSFLFGK